MPHNDEPRQRTLILVHGGSYKAEAGALSELWMEALAAGLQRDFGKRGGRKLLETVNVEMAYFGDLINPTLEQTGRRYDPHLDLEDRRADLRRLVALSSKKKFRRAHYEALPGKTAVREFVADLAAPVMLSLGLGSRVLKRTTPALGAYFSEDTVLREHCEKRLMAVLQPALARGDDVLLLSHAMGSVVSYDALWRLTHEASDATPAPGRVHTWITFGSPLANAFVRRQLRGARHPQRRYPDKVINWYNVSAEDDFHCHDKTVANDFAGLLKQQQISQIRDFRIYNLAIRYGRSNPHNAVGYLVHPRLSKLVREWLVQGAPVAPPASVEESEPAGSADNPRDERGEQHT